jgi:hypothetical protein
VNWARTGEEADVSVPDHPPTRVGKAYTHWLKSLEDVDEGALTKAVRREEE